MQKSIPFLTDKDFFLDIHKKDKMELILIHVPKATPSLLLSLLNSIACQKAEVSWSVTFLINGVITFLITFCLDAVLSPSDDISIKVVLLF